MTRTVYFIDEEYLKENSIISLNIDSSLINVAIITAQDIKIQPLLGTKLYDKIKELLPTDISLTENKFYYELFYDYIVPLTLHWTTFECLLNLKFKLTNKSVSEQYSDNSTSAELGDIKFLRENISNKAEFYGQRLIDYLHENYDEFDEYTDTCADDGMVPQKDSYYTGMYLGNNNTTRRWN
jgi:hypothetical protein